jgi:glycosyltransferase involved in cell wall biosynthesis
MHIAQVAPIAESVPPKLYGGTERVVAWLTDALIDLGHRVTLFASGDSSTKADLVAVWPSALRLGHPPTDPMLAHAALLEAVAGRAHEFDVIHCHVDWTLLPLLIRQPTPFVTTCHGRLDLPGLDTVLQKFPWAPFVSISDRQRAPVQSANWFATVYHGMPVDLLSPSYADGEYLAFLGRLTPEKGPEAAIRIAHATGLPLHIAAKLPRGERGFYKKHLQPLVDGNQVRIIGEVNDRAKQGFLSGARAVLFPITWPEPFGLVMIESMACGTPVIAFRAGSVPEVIEEGVTGFIVESEEEAVDVIKHRLPKLDRRRVREGFERRFSSRRMAEDYVNVYQQLVGGIAQHLNKSASALTMRHSVEVAT